MPADLPDLARDYGLDIGEVHPHPGGFGTDGLVADGKWFVKLWRGGEPPERLELLGELSAAGLPVPAAIPAATGELYSWWQGRPYAVFPYITGRPADDDRDWRLTAQAMKQIHGLDGIDLPLATLDEPHVWWLRDQLDHPWLADRRHVVADNLLRLERTTARARAKSVPQVVCHRDLHGLNLLIDDDHVAAVLDWEVAAVAPREHDLWIAASGTHGKEFLTEYGATDLDLDHLEYALLARALRDMSARVSTQTDRPGVDTWGFRRIAKLERDLEMFRPFCL
jgi:Ser/Thr protein kinase RdoA (MazF antagonist)